VIDSPSINDLKLTVDVSVLDPVPLFVTIFPEVDSDTVKSSELVNDWFVKITLEPIAIPELNSSLRTPEYVPFVVHIPVMSLESVPTAKPPNAEATSAGLIASVAVKLNPPTVIDSVAFKAGKLTADVSKLEADPCVVRMLALL